MLPDLESLRCFEAAATHLSFRVAANAVALSPAAFGDRIKRLEDQLSVALFMRTTRRVALTPAGHQLLPQARRVLEEAARCMEVVHERAAAYDLTIGTRFELGLSWITPALQRLHTRRPERTLHLVFGDSADLVNRARNALLDAVITSARVVTTGLSYEVLHEEDYVFVGSASLIARKPLSRGEHASEHVLIDGAPDLPLFRYFLDSIERRDTWSFGKLEYLGTIGAIRLRVLQNAGVAVLPKYFVDRDLRAERLVRLVPKVKLARDAFRLIWRVGHPREPALRQLAEDLAAIPLS
ncbi:MAG: LysR family transcriptional regulator [Kofleriaceae bacterium]